MALLSIADPDVKAEGDRETPALARGLPLFEGLAPTVSFAGTH